MERQVEYLRQRGVQEVVTDIGSGLNEKRRSVQRKASHSKKAKRVLSKYSKRERNRARKHQLEIARVVQSLCGSVGLEELKKQGMYTLSLIHI